MNSCFSKKRVLLYSGLLAFAMSSAFAGDTPLIFANNYVSTGAGAWVKGNIQANNYVTTGANSNVSGDILTGAAATLGAYAEVGGVISADAAITAGANADVKGTVKHGSAFTLTEGINSDIEFGSYVSQPSVTFNNQDVIEAQAAYSDMGLKEEETSLPPTITINTTLTPGLYSAASLATTAGITITLNGTGTNNTDHWVFNITDILSFGANTKIELSNTGNKSRIIWNSGGYTSVGAGAQIKGIILAHAYVSTGAGSTLSGVDSCGSIFSATSYVSIGALSEVGLNDCSTNPILLQVAEAANGDTDHAESKDDNEFPEASVYGLTPPPEITNFLNG